MSGESILVSVTVFVFSVICVGLALDKNRACNRWVKITALMFIAAATVTMGMRYYIYRNRISWETPQGRLYLTTSSQVGGLRIGLLVPLILSGQLWQSRKKKV